VRQRELLQLGPCELVAVIPTARTDTSTLLADRVAPFGIADLLEPETRGRRVQQPEQPQMIVLARPLRQLDHRSRLLEHLSAAIQHKMVMRRHKSKCNRMGDLVTLPEEH